MHIDNRQLNEAISNDSFEPQSECVWRACFLRRVYYSYAWRYVECGIAFQWGSTINYVPSQVGANPDMILYGTSVVQRGVVYGCNELGDCNYK